MCKAPRRHAAGGRRSDGLGRDRLQRSAQAVGVSGFVLREQSAQHRAQAFVDQMDVGQIPGRIADFEAGQMAVLVRRLETAALDDDGSVALSLGASLG